MFIETIDLLRCPNPHEETWLVASFRKMDGRFIREGTLGCPVCDATFLIEDGIADFRLTPGENPIAVPAAPDDEEAMRLAAYLNLVRQGSIVVLERDDARHAPAVANLTQSRVIALNPSTRIDDTELTSTVLCDDGIPLAASSVDGVAASMARTVHDAARVLRPSGRLVAPAESALPPGIAVLARDEKRIVAEARGPLVQLSR